MLFMNHFDSVFTTLDKSKIIHDPVTFFAKPPVSDPSYLTDINFNESGITLLSFMKYAYYLTI